MSHLLAGRVESHSLRDHVVALEAPDVEGGFESDFGPAPDAVLVQPRGLMRTLELHFALVFQRALG